MYKTDSQHLKLEKGKSCECITEIITQQQINRHLLQNYQWDASF